MHLREKIMNLLSVSVCVPNLLCEVITVVHGHVVATGWQARIDLWGTGREDTARLLL